MRKIGIAQMYLPNFKITWKKDFNLYKYEHQENFLVEIRCHLLNKIDLNKETRR